MGDVLHIYSSRTGTFLLLHVRSICVSGTAPHRQLASTDDKTLVMVVSALLCHSAPLRRDGIMKNGRDRDTRDVTIS